MRVLLVRHGESEWNALRRLQGQADISLSQTGRQQAASLAPVIRDIAPDRIIVSDLKRTRETAALLQIEGAEYTADLRENNVGDWTGRDISEIVAEDEPGWLDWRAGKSAPPNGESWQDFTRRVSGAIHRQQQHPCENLLVVCHGGVIRALLQHFLGLDPANIIPVGPGSLTALRLANGSGKPHRLELFNYRPDRLEFEAPD